MEENEQDNIAKNVGNKLKEGAKKQAKNATREIIKKALKIIAPVLLKLFIILIVSIILIQALNWLLSIFSSTTSKESSTESIIYGFIPTDEEPKEKSGYKVIVKLDAEQKAYRLEYQFNNEDGTEISQDKVLKSIKNDLKKENLDSSKFTESELKILAVLKENGLVIDNYTEDELKCFALFVKAEIAGQCFDLRDKNNIGQEVDIEEIRKSEYVYGTLRAQKITALGGKDTGAETTYEETPVITPEILNGLTLEHKNGWNYYIKTPENTDKENKLPLILFLYGEGDKVYTNFVNDIPKLGISQSISSGDAFESGDFIYAVPHINYDNGGVVTKAKDFIDFMVNTYNIDENRIILAGVSSGGYYTWSFINKYPNLLAGAMIFSAYGEKNIDNYLKTPIWGIAGDRADRWGNDDAPRWRSLSSCIATIRSKISNKENAKATQLINCNHSQSLDVFLDKYSSIVSRKELFDWMLSKDRKTNTESTEGDKTEEYTEISQKPALATGSGYYNVRELTYKEYQAFMYMVNQNNVDVENYFTIDKEEKLITATWSSSSTQIRYLDENDNELSEEKIAQISEENQREATGRTMVYTTTPLAYKKHITKYSLKYGLLSDMLIATRNADFCTELTALAFNSKIVITLREETTYGSSYSKVKYAVTDITCKKVDYKVNGDKVTSATTIRSTFYGGSAGSASAISFSYKGSDCGWSSVNKSAPSFKNDNAIGFIWTYNGQKYELIYFKKGNYIISKLTDKPAESTPYPTVSGTDELIKNGTDEEFGDYTSKNNFTYVVETTTSSTTHSYKYFDISEIDTWFAKYKKEYSGIPEAEKRSSGSGPKEVKGELQKKTEEIIESAATILGDSNAQSFKTSKENAYKQTYTDAQNVECTVTKLTIENWGKEDKVSNSSSGSISYRFPEEEVDTTEIKYKNVEIVGDKAQYTDKNQTERGFLYLYDKYVKKEDLFLSQDAERELFTMLNKGTDTKKYVDVLKVLLYAYDGVDRDLDDPDLSFFKVRPIKIRSGSLQMLTHTKITKEEFVEKVQAYNNSRSTQEFRDGADIIYDICVQNNINPVFCAAQALKEQGWRNPGRGVANYNFWGIGVFNGQKTGFNYNDMADGVQHYCNQINSQLNGKIRGTYQSLAKQYATVRPDKYKGDMSTIYDVFSAYCALDNSDTHTLQENADHAVQYLDSIIKIGKNIFGDDIFGLYDSLVDAAYAVGDHFLNSGVLVHYAGDDVDVAVNNGRRCVYKNIQGSYDYPIENPEKYGVVCATFVSLALWQSGLIDEDTINKYGYNATGGVRGIVNDPTYASNWETITDFNELEEGDIVQTQGHVWIYIEGCKCLDQNYCVRNSADTWGPTRAPYNASSYASQFIEAYRYVGV